LFDNGFIKQPEELIMKAAEISFYEWQQRFATETACLEHLAQLRWPNGFQCPKCGHDHGYYTKYRRHYECAACHKQTSVMSETLFHGTPRHEAAAGQVVLGYLLGGHRQGQYLGPAAVEADRYDLEYQLPTAE